MSDDERRLAPGPASEAVAYGVGDKIKFETSGLVPRDWALVTEKHERFVSVRVGKHEWSFDPDDPEDFVVTDVKEAAAGGYQQSAWWKEAAERANDQFRSSRAEPKPIAEMDDMIKVNGEWRRVVDVTDYGRPRVENPDLDGWPVIEPIEIEEVYTKAEQQANGALVQIEWFGDLDEPAYVAADARGAAEIIDWDYREARAEEFHFLTPEAVEALGEFRPAPDYGALVTVPWQEIDDLIYDVLPSVITWDNGVDHWSEDEDEHYVLTPEATAALGEFRPVPDRAIKTGDVVRDQYDDVFIVDAESRMYAYDAADDVHERPISYGDLSLVAPEDPEYREAKERGEGFDGSCDPHPDDSWVSGAQPDAGQGEKSIFTRALEALGQPPVPEDDGHDGWCGCADCGDGPDPAPEWQSWPTIADRDGNALRNISEIVPEHIRGEKRWASLDDQDEWFTDDEVAAMGPVRRAVVVTLPDEHEWENVQVENGQVHLGTHFGWTPPADVKDHAAEMLAAALHAEEGDNA